MKGFIEMKSKILALAAVGLMAGAVQADVLYWQVSENPGVDYSTAMLSAKTSDPENYYYVSQNTVSGGSAGELVDKSALTGGNYAAGDLSSILSWDTDEAYTGSASSLSFFVELYDSAGNWVAQSNPIPYSQLTDFVASSPSFNSNFAGANSTFGGGTTSYGIPEPTSGLLMLVGLGALALRRRKA